MGMAGGDMRKMMLVWMELGNAVDLCVELPLPI